MKSSLITILSIILILTAVNCKKEDKYVNEKAILDQFCKITDTMTRGLDRCKNRIGFGKAIVNFIRDFKSIKKDIGKIEEKYPELRITGGEKTAPPELKAHFLKVTQSLARMKVVLEGKKSRFGANPDVHKIVLELKEVMYYY